MEAVLFLFGVRNPMSAFFLLFWGLWSPPRTAMDEPSKFGVGLEVLQRVRWGGLGGVESGAGTGWKHDFDAHKGLLVEAVGEEDVR